MRAGITPRMCPLPIPRMSKNEATESQRQSEAIRGNQRQSVACHTEAIRDHQIQSGHTSGAIRCNRTPIRHQSDAIRRNQHWQSGDIQGHSDAISMPGALCFPCFRVLGGPQGPVFCVFVFWAGTTGLCFVFSCFGRPPSKHSTGPILLGRWEVTGVLYRGGLIKLPRARSARVFCPPQARNFWRC